MKNAPSPPPETISLPALASFFIATLSVLLWNGCAESGRPDSGGTSGSSTDNSEIRVILNPYHPESMEGREWFEQPFLTSETIKLTAGDHYDSPGAVAWRTKNGNNGDWPAKGGLETPGDSNWVGVTPVKTIFYSPNDPGSSGVDGLGEEVDTIDTNRSGFYTIEYKVEFTYPADLIRDNDVVREGAATRTVIVKDPVQIATWGYSEEGGLGGPTDFGYRDVVASGYAFTAIKQDGSIFTWGDPQGGGAGPVEDKYSEVSAHKYGFMAVSFRGDGWIKEIVQWGNSSVPPSLRSAPSLKPFNFLDFSPDIVTSDRAYATINEDGTLSAWGAKKFGGEGVPSNSSNKQLVASQSAFAALDAEGFVRSWGNARNGGAGAPANGVFESIWANRKAFAAIQVDGSISVWGDPNSGGKGGPEDKGYSWILGNDAAFAALRNGGFISAWGDRFFGGDGAPNDGGYVSIYKTASAFAALKEDGTVFVWGDSRSGGAGAPTEKIAGPIYSTRRAFAARTQEGKMVAWGDAYYGGNYDLPAGVTLDKIVANDMAFAGLASDGKVYAWGDPKYGGAGGGIRLPSGTGYQRIVATRSAFAAIRPADFKPQSFTLKQNHGLKGTDHQRTTKDASRIDSSLDNDPLLVTGLNGAMQPLQQVVLQPEDVFETLYSNTADPLNGFVDEDSREMGDEIILSDRNDPTVNQFLLEYYSDAPKGAFVIRLRANDGDFIPDVGKMPGSILYESPSIQVEEGYNTTIVNMDVVIPGGRLTYTVEFTGLSEGQKAGLVLRDPPSIGSSYSDYWVNDGGWGTKLLNGVKANFAAMLISGQDTQPPIIALEGEAQVTTEQGATYQDAGATAVDHVDGDLSDKIVTENPLDADVPGTYIITYNVTDQAGNVAIELTRTVTVIPMVVVDEVAPEIALIGEAQIRLEQGATYTDEGATAEDDIDGDLSDKVVTENPVDVNVPDTYIITYNVTDQAGNPAIEQTRTVTVIAGAVADVIPPEIALTGEAQIRLQQGANYTDEGATAEDQVDGDLSDKIVTENPVDVNVPGTYIITYNVTDQAGNPAIEQTRTVTVIAGAVADVIPPEISLEGDAEIILPYGMAYNEQGAKAVDDVDGELDVTIEGEVDVNVIGDYEITYTASDAADNTTTLIRTVSVSLGLRPGDVYFLWNEDKHKPADGPKNSGGSQLELEVLRLTVENEQNVIVESFKDTSQSTVINPPIPLTGLQAASSGRVLESSVKDQSGILFGYLPFSKISAKIAFSSDSLSEFYLDVGFNAMELAGDLEEAILRSVEDNPNKLRHDVATGLTHVQLGPFSRGSIPVGGAEYQQIVEDDSDSESGISLGYRNRRLSVTSADELVFKTYKDEAGEVLSLSNTSIVLREIQATSNPYIYTTSLQEDVGRIFGMPYKALKGQVSFSDDYVSANLDIGFSIDGNDSNIRLFAETFEDVTYDDSQGMMHVVFGTLNRIQQAVKEQNDLLLNAFPSFARASEDGVQIEGRLSVEGGGDAILLYSLKSPVQGLSLDADGNYRFKADGHVYQSLEEGETLDVIAEWQVNAEGTLAVASSILTITVEGEADVSTVIMPETVLTVFQGDAPISGTLNGPATGNSIYRLIGDIPGLSLNGDGNYLFDPGLPEYDTLDIGKSLEMSADWRAIIPLAEGNKDYIGAIKVSVAAKNRFFTFEDSGENSLQITACNRAASGYVRIPSTFGGKKVTAIGMRAFERCEDITGIELPESLITIGEYAFEGCHSLSAITIPSRVETIGRMAFSRCNKLRNVTIGEGLEQLNDMVFNRCALLQSINFSGSSVAPLLEDGDSPFNLVHRDAKVYIGSGCTGFGSSYGGLPVECPTCKIQLGGSLVTNLLRQFFGTLFDGPIANAIVFFDANLNNKLDDGEPFTSSNGRGDYILDIPFETYDTNQNGILEISEGIIIAQGGTDTATGLPLATHLTAPADSKVVNPLTTLVTRVMQKNPDFSANTAADMVAYSLDLPSDVDVLTFDAFDEAAEQNPDARRVITANAKVQDILLQTGNLISGATNDEVQAGADAMINAMVDQVVEDQTLDLDGSESLENLIVSASLETGADLSEDQLQGAVAIMEASSQAKQDLTQSLSSVTELASEVSRIQAVSQSVTADGLKAFGLDGNLVDEIVLGNVGEALQEQVSSEVVGDLFNALPSPASLAFEYGEYTVMEDGSQPSVATIYRTGEHAVRVDLMLKLVEGSASEGNDFKGQNIVVNFEAFELRKNIDLRALMIDDLLPERDETFTMQLELLDFSGEPGSSVAILGDNASATVSIISDEAANQPPSVSNIDDLSLSEGAEKISVDFSVIDTDTPLNQITVKASTSNPFLISELVVEGVAGEQGASQWVLVLTTVANQFGEGSISIEINDGYQIVSTSFNVTVSAVNNAPEISGIPSMIEAEGKRVVVPFEVSDDQTSAGNLFIYLTAQPLDYILKGHVLVVGNGAQRELILNNSGNAEGTGQFSVVVTDADGKTASQAFQADFGGDLPVTAAPELKLNASDPSNLILSWEGDAVLLFTDDLSAGFEVIQGATSPHTIKTVDQGFYLLRAVP